jgi:hypothetical protein
MSGMVFWWIYEYYYDEKSTSDTFRFFDDGLILYQILLEDPITYFKILTGIYTPSVDYDFYFYQMNNWYKPFEDGIYNDNRTLIRMNAFWSIFSFGNYHVHTVFASFTSLVGMLGISKFISNHLPENKIIVFLMISLFPSTIFWTSGVLKECYLFFCFGLNLYFFLKMVENFNIKYLSLFFFTLFLLFWIKIYIFMIYIPCLLIYFLVSKFNFQKVGVLYVSSFSLIAFLVVVINYFFPDYGLIDALVRKQNAFISMSKTVGAGSFFEMNYLDGSFKSIILQIPASFYNVFFRPEIKDLNKLLMIPPFLENLFILFYLIFSFYFLQKNIDFKKRQLFCFSLCFVGILTVIIGLTTPVVGAIVRYRIIIFPLLLILPLTYSNILNVIINKLKK